jgi:hypothetical protein
MAEHGFDIKITDASVDVRRDPPPSLKGRIRGASLLVGVGFLFLCGLLFLSGKNGTPSIWVELSSKPFLSANFLIPFFILLAFIPLMAWFSTRWALAAWPSDDALHCDRTELTVLRAKWFDSQNKLVSQAYPLESISQMRFGSIASAKGSTIYGLRFRANGKKQKLLAGLEAPEADTILKVLKTLGVDVPDDPDLKRRIKERLEWRGEDTSWMDRSWMDHK